MTLEEASLFAYLMTIERFVKPYSYLNCHSFLLYNLYLGTLRMCDNIVVYLYTGDETKPWRKIFWKFEEYFHLV